LSEENRATAAGTFTENLLEYGHVVFVICKWTVMLIAIHHTSPSGREGVNSKLLKKMHVQMHRYALVLNRSRL